MDHALALSQVENEAVSPVPVEVVDERQNEENTPRHHSASSFRAALFLFLQLS